MSFKEDKDLEPIVPNSDSEVEEALELLRYNFVQWSAIGLEHFNTIKQHIQAQVNEIEIHSNDKIELIAKNNKLHKSNLAYKQLLDEIGEITYTPLDEEANFKEFKRIDNIIKKLKSLGGK